MPITGNIPTLPEPKKEDILPFGGDASRAAARAIDGVHPNDKRLVEPFGGEDMNIAELMVEGIKEDLEN